jgi:hypothetical protein
MRTKTLRWRSRTALRRLTIVPFIVAALVVVLFAAAIYFRSFIPGLILIPLFLLRRRIPLFLPRSRRDLAAKQDVIDGVRRWAAARGFDPVEGAGALTLPARGYPFSRTQTHWIEAVFKKRVGSHDVLVMLLRLGQDGAHVLDDGHAFTVVAAHVAADYPTTVVAPRGYGGRVRRALGPGLEVESGEFNKEWRVFTTSPADAHACLSPVVIDALVRRAQGDTLPVQWDGNAIFTASPEYTAVADSLDARVALVARLAEESLGFQAASDAAASPDAFLTPSRPEPLDANRLGVALAFLWLGTFAGAIIVDAIRGGHTGFWGFAIPLAIVIGGTVVFVAVWLRHVPKQRREWVDRYRSGKP